MYNEGASAQFNPRDAFATLPGICPKTLARQGEASPSIEPHGMPLPSI